MKQGIYLFNQVVVLDFAEPFEVFSTASRVKLLLDQDAGKTFSVFTISETGRNIRARGGLEIKPN